MKKVKELCLSLQTPQAQNRLISGSLTNQSSGLKQLSFNQARKTPDEGYASSQQFNTIQHSSAEEQLGKLKNLIIAASQTQMMSTNGSEL